MASGSMALAEELFARGDPAFVGELRRVHDAERLGQFATRWLTDKRPSARHLLIDYLSRPLNAYRHEALVKRLFKGIEKAGDDELMGVFLVALDRALRRERKIITRHQWDSFSSRREAEARAQEWAAAGFHVGPFSSYSGKLHVYASKKEKVVVAPANKMPRPSERESKRTQQLNDTYRQRLERKYVLFSVPTRRYLRRRAWRYFRKMSKIDQNRYRTAAVLYLKRYQDTDVDSDIHLLDNWGLIHTLFHHSAALVRPARGWEFAAGKTLAHLAPSPYFPESWRAAPDALFELLTQANCRPVRQWAACLLRAGHMEWMGARPLESFLALIDHVDPDVAEIGFELLETHPDLGRFPVEVWLHRLDGDNLDRLQRLSELLLRRLQPHLVNLTDAVKLAMHRSLPVARLGASLLRSRDLAAADLPVVLPLTQAECASIRTDLARWLMQTLSQHEPLPANWLLEFLDSKHADVRACGWHWLQDSALKDDPLIWQRLLESPYDDIREPIVAELAKRTQLLELDAVQNLWAAVLLNIHRGGRYKPGVVAQAVTRLVEHPDEADRLLPLLAVAVRSLRGPEFRAGLSGIVALAERAPAVRPALARQFPELAMT